MNKQGFTLVEIMIVVAIIALLAAIAIPNLLRARMSANDSLAKATLRAMSTAAESYATANNGNYPPSESALTNATPPYLNKAYCANSPIAGFTYDCAGMSTAGYTIVATPLVVNSTGSTVETITTGGVLTP
ncbi:MAG: prepilin-type N-terminal cleavage/methylation domain-containing protein [Candidatus Omnitrophica bacterium]|nr:prepilin-type N-terminal cleavage/methylation domain-containing protein [Candidatus Omnitrophota bacterium]MDE2010382.1 prepilin-type N-terminal cleavage/methylation domain-containing protein [Candidatus Omnitrophota bacterium]MDE2214876.1 prepilin-type N-terminal cleavage/methylation domain-containing protein [Candidatus Omnitrophota bacterium]MDE2230793.1 prepilin-type N-terminal cleavage/methylation domain-containing protein [Candidatus Omnitrophota bacterium]